MYLSQFLTVLTVHLTGLISPGPTFAMIVRNSLLYSRKNAITTNVGLALGTLTHVAFALLGVAVIISNSIVLFNIIKYLGAAYLVFIGYRSLTHKQEETSPKLSESDYNKLLENNASPFSFIQMGFLTNFLNPYTPLWMLTIFTQVIDPVTPSFIRFLFGVQVVLTSFSFFCVVSLLLTNKFFKSKITRFQSYVEPITGVILIGFAIRLFFSSHL